MKTFLLSAWIEENIPQKYQRLGLRIWEDCPPDVVERVREAFELGKEVTMDEVRQNTVTQDATIEGLTNALNAKNETSVTVHQVQWPLVIVILVLIGVEVFRFFHG